MVQSTSPPVPPEVFFFFLRSSMPPVEFALLENIIQIRNLEIEKFRVKKHGKVSNISPCSSESFAQPELKVCPSYSSGIQINHQTR